MDESDDPSPSMPAVVAAGFMRTATMRVRGTTAWYASGRNEDEAARRAGRLLKAVAARKARRRLVRWLKAARALHLRDPHALEAKTLPGDPWSRFVHTIAVMRRGRTLLTVPNLHGWPLAGPMDAAARLLDPSDLARILETLCTIPRQPKDWTPASDVERAGPLFAALLSTTMRDVHDLMSDAEGRCWFHVGIEQEDGLSTCVIDPMESLEAYDAFAWHPPASAADAVPLRLVCERSEKGWRIDGCAWKDAVEATRPPVLDAMENLRLCAPHV